MKDGQIKDEQIDEKLKLSSIYAKFKGNYHINRYEVRTSPPQP